MEKTRLITVNQPHSWYISAAKAFINLYTQKTKNIYLKMSSKEYLKLITYSFGYCDLTNLLYAADELGYIYGVDEKDSSVYYFNFRPRNIWKR